MEVLDPLNPAQTPAKLIIPTLDWSILGATMHPCVSESQGMPASDPLWTPWTC
jgi:hypothetical protein